MRIRLDALRPLGVLLALLISASAGQASPLAAFTDHAGEDHSFEDHRDAFLEGINLTDATLVQTDFKKAVLTNAIMTSVNLTNAVLQDADLTGANLAGALLTDVQAKKADFTNANLNGVSFATGDVKNAVFVGASLLGADLSSLTNADKADFAGARYSLATLLAPGMDPSTMTLVPEPSSAMLFLFGLLGLEIYARRLAPRRRELVGPRCI